MFYGSLKRNDDQEGRMQIPLVLIRGTRRNAVDLTSNDNDPSIPCREPTESSPSSDALLLPATVYRPEPKVTAEPTESLPTFDLSLLPASTYQPTPKVMNESVESPPSSDLLLLPATTYRPPPRVRVLKPSSEVNVLPPTRPERELLLPTTYQAPRRKGMEGPSSSDECRLHSQASGSSQETPVPPPMRPRENRPVVDPRRWVRAREAFIRGETLDGLNLELNQRAARLPESDRVPTPEPQRLPENDSVPTPESPRPLRPRSRPLGERPDNLALLISGQLTVNDISRSPSLPSPGIPRSPSVQELISRRASNTVFTELRVDVSQLSPALQSALGDTSPRFDDKMKLLLGEPKSEEESGSEKEDKSLEPPSVSEPGPSEAARDDDQSLYSSHDPAEEESLDAQEDTSEFYEHALAGPYENLPESESPLVGHLNQDDLDLMDLFPLPPSIRRASRGAIGSSRRAGQFWTPADFETGQGGDNWSPFTAEEGMEVMEDSTSQYSIAGEQSRPFSRSSQAEQPERSSSVNHVSFEPFSSKQTATLPSCHQDDPEQGQEQAVVGGESTRRKLQKKSSKKHLLEPKQATDKTNERRILRRVKSFFTGKKGDRSSAGVETPS